MNKITKIPIHTSSKDHKESGYGLDSRFLTISCRSCDSYPTRSGRVGKTNHLRPIYIIGSIIENTNKRAYVWFVDVILRM